MIQNHFFWCLEPLQKVDDFLVAVTFFLNLAVFFNRFFFFFFLKNLITVSLHHIISLFHVFFVFLFSQGFPFRGCSARHNCPMGRGYASWGALANEKRVMWSPWSVLCSSFVVSSLVVTKGSPRVQAFGFSTESDPKKPRLRVPQAVQVGLSRLWKCCYCFLWP